MKERRELTDVCDVELLVNSFYAAIRHDKVLGPLFEEKLAGRWPQHITRMVSFWETILLERHSYTGRPFAPHANLPVNDEHFEEWRRLFDKTVDTHFKGEKAEEAKQRASKMAMLFSSRIEYNKLNPGRMI